MAQPVALSSVRHPGVGAAADRPGGREAAVGPPLARTMNREQLIRRLRARVIRGGPAEQVWWNGELVHVAEAIARASELPEDEPIQARGDDVVVLRQLEPSETLYYHHP